MFSIFFFFFFSPLGWKVVLVNFFSSWILSGSSIKQCWFLENFEVWAGNWPASNVSAPPRPVKSSTSPPLSQLTELRDNISFLSFSWPFCSLRKKRDGLCWPCSLRCSFFWKLNFSDKRIFWCQPQGLWGMHMCEDKPWKGWWCEREIQTLKIRSWNCY